jgi:hypothetical protein
MSNLGKDKNAERNSPASAKAEGAEKCNSNDSHDCAVAASGNRELAKLAGAVRIAFPQSAIR